MHRNVCVSSTVWTAITAAYCALTYDMAEDHVASAGRCMVTSCLAGSQLTSSWIWRLSVRYTAAVSWLVAWHSRTSVLNRRTFPVLRSTCSWRVTIYVGKPSSACQPIRPTQPFVCVRPFRVNKLSSELLYLMCAGSAVWWVFTRLSQVRFINRWAPFAACSLPAKPFCI